MSTDQMDLWTRPEDVVVHMPVLTGQMVSAADVERSRLYRLAEVLDCCTGMACDPGWNGREPYWRSRCGRCGAYGAPYPLYLDHDSPGTPCPGTITLPASALNSERLRAWRAVPTAYQHAMRHDRRHWPDCADCSCPWGLHASSVERWPWADPGRSRCAGCRYACDGWRAPEVWPVGLTPDLRAVWLERALTEAGLS